MNQPPQGWGGPPQSQPGYSQGQPGYPPQSGPGFPNPNVPSEADKKAQLSMYLGLGSILCSAFTGIPAVILGITSLKEASPAAKTKAYVGIVVGGGASALLLLGLLASAGSKKSEATAATATDGSAPSASASASTKKKSLSELSAEIKKMNNNLRTREQQEAVSKKGNELLKEANVSIPVTLGAGAATFLSDPTPMTECFMDLLTLKCTFKVTVKKALGKSDKVVLNCLDSDGAVITTDELHPSHDDQFDGKAPGDKVRVSPWMATSWDKNVASFELRVGNGKGEKGDGTADKDAPKSDKKGTFPDLVGKFHAMTEIQQKKYAETFEGTVLSGSGNVFEVEKCGFTDDSQDYGKGCWKVVLDNGNPRVALYHSDDDEEKIAKYKKGQRISFKDCKGISIKNWGFWSTATCDMPSSK